MARRHLVIAIAAVALIAGGTLVMAGPGGPGGPGLRGGGRGGPCGSGQGPGAGGRFEGRGGPLGHLDRALHRLDLSDEQWAQVHALVEAAEPQLETLRTQLRDNRREFHQSRSLAELDEAAIRAHVAAQSAVMADLAVARARLQVELLRVLTPEQRAELEAMRDKMHEWRSMRRDFWGEGS